MCIFSCFRTQSKKEVSEDELDWASKLKKVSAEEAEAGDVVDEGVGLKKVTQELVPLELGERTEVELVCKFHEPNINNTVDAFC